MLVDMRVASFCHYLQGPAASQYLADMGADVIKVEAPGGAYERRWSGGVPFAGGISTFFLCANRNKRCIAVDLKHDAGREIALRLIESSDVVLENFRPGVMDKLGLGYEHARARKPDIIYASATGFGSDGPLRDRPGQDLLIQARSGLIAATGDHERRPTPVGNAAVDQHGAALLAMGILGAFVRRLQTGEGTRVEGSLLNAGLDLQTEPLTMYFSGGGTKDLFRRDPNLATWYHEAPYGVYRMADRFVAFSLGELGRLGRALGSEAIAALQGRDAAAERNELAAVIAREVAGLRIADVADSLDAAGVWYAVVQDFDEVREDPQVVHNGALLEVPIGERTATLVNHPNRYDGKGAEVRVLATRIGEHSREVLGEIGYADSDIERYLAEKVIVAPGRGDGA